MHPGRCLGRHSARLEARADETIMGALSHARDLPSSAACYHRARFRVSLSFTNVNMQKLLRTKQTRGGWNITLHAVGMDDYNAD